MAERLFFLFTFNQMFLLIKLEHRLEVDLPLVGTWQVYTLVLVSEAILSTLFNLGYR